MPNPNKSAQSGWPWAAIAALSVLFIAGIQEVARAPLETGDAYPPYSSLRADPLGAKALYESLQALPELSVARLYRDQTEGTKLSNDAVLFQLGIDASSWRNSPKDALLNYEKMLAHGGRIVFAFLPVNAQADVGLDEATNGDGDHDENKSSNVAAGDVAGRWRIRFVYRSPAPGEKAAQSLPRRTALSFALGPEWRVLAQADGLPVAAGRTLGNGSIVVVADSFPLSNEGLRAGRDVKLLTEILGGAQCVYFDENQLGVSETGSVAGLIRRYRMESAVAVILLAALLFVWRNASSFLPPAIRSIEGEQTVSGRNTQDGMAALLRRSTTEQQLIETCYAEWARSGPKDGRARQLIAEMQSAAEQDRSANSDPVAAYQAACAALTKKILQKD